MIRDCQKKGQLCRALTVCLSPIFEITTSLVEQIYIKKTLKRYFLHVKIQSEVRTRNVKIRDFQ